jgi:nucleoside-diphosphate-sugar epimerase
MKRLLIAGFGDIARRAQPQLESRFEITRLSRRHGFDLDRPETLQIGGVHAVLHCAPPPTAGEADPRTANLLAALEKASILPARLAYVSTSGVYGDCAGARVDESQPPAPQSARARRRVDAERQLSAWCASRNVALVILRAPGIYAAERLPLERLKARTPVLRREDDVYTNHIHAEDLALAAVRALEPDAPAGIYNASDDSELLMGDWFDLLADSFGLPRPPRIARAQASSLIPAPLLSFMSESRRLVNRRIKSELGVSLRYPTVRDGISHAISAGAHQSS